MKQTKYKLADYLRGMLGGAVIALLFTLFLNVEFIKSFIIVYTTAWIVFKLNTK